jgi:hypothetical protein
MRNDMAKIWVLDTETKGTGANMVPLERVLKKPNPHPEPLYVPPKRRAPEQKPPEPRPPREFKIVDLMSREVLAEGTSARETLLALQEVRSIVDVNVYVWQPDDERWRLLTLGEKRLMWDSRDEAELPLATP